ncbi:MULTISPECIES: hypothetical protein [unclassified Mesorhizobium]|uniref:hypothetical protein n=1 Tax=unclassified Mesorhizobium TaxID=325217 RepID=UPI00115CC04C|nr:MULTISPECIES: hypothetical protein [unclassified Mesorhizobium]TRD08223.1 hypothetical protein FJV82_06055 [Mesorhizobium sp. WSM4305]
MTRRFIFTSYFFETLASTEPARTANHRGSLLARVTLWFVDLFWREYHAARGEPTESQALKASLISREIAPDVGNAGLKTRSSGYAQAGAVASRTSRAICLDMM